MSLTFEQALAMVLSSRKAADMTNSQVENAARVLMTALNALK